LNVAFTLSIVLVVIELQCKPFWDTPLDLTALRFHAIHMQLCKLIVLVSHIINTDNRRAG